MTPIPQEEFDKRFSQLPEELQEAIFSEDIASTLLAIGKKYNLSIDTIGDLSTEVKKVMLGMAHPKDFIRNVKAALNTDQETAKNIAHEVNKQIFAAIREALKRIHKEDQETPKPVDTEKQKKVPPQESPGKSGTTIQETTPAPESHTLPEKESLPKPATEKVMDDNQQQETTKKKIPVGPKPSTEQKQPEEKKRQPSPYSFILPKQKEPKKDITIPEKSPKKSPETPQSEPSIEKLPRESEGEATPSDSTENQSSPFQQKMDEDNVFRTKQSHTEQTEESASLQNQTPSDKSQYPNSDDPYREPVSPRDIQKKKRAA